MEKRQALRGEITSNNHKNHLILSSIKPHHRFSHNINHTISWTHHSHLLFPTLLPIHHLHYKPSIIQKVQAMRTGNIEDSKDFYNDHPSLSASCVISMKQNYSLINNLHKKQQQQYRSNGLEHYSCIKDHLTSNMEFNPFTRRIISPFQPWKNHCINKSHHFHKAPKSNESSKSDSNKTIEWTIGGGRKLIILSIKMPKERYSTHSAWYKKIPCIVASVNQPSLDYRTLEIMVVESQVKNVHAFKQQHLDMLEP